jgi:hypothetical protein
VCIDFGRLKHKPPLPLAAGVFCLKHTKQTAISIKTGFKYHEKYASIHPSTYNRPPTYRRFGRGLGAALTTCTMSIFYPTRCRIRRQRVFIFY